jgi:hypothetical protein
MPAIEELIERDQFPRDRDSVGVGEPGPAGGELNALTPSEAQARRFSGSEDAHLADPALSAAARAAPDSKLEVDSNEGGRVALPRSVAALGTAALDLPASILSRGIADAERLLAQRART